MSCLLCNFVGSSTAELHKHYILYDRINPDNYFFWKYLRMKMVGYAKNA